MDNIAIFLCDFLLGNNTFRAKILPITTVNIPANVKRHPANNICVPVASDVISNHRYPNLIAGNALPHKRQQIVAKSAIIKGLLKIDTCSFLFIVLYTKTIFSFFFIICRQIESSHNNISNLIRFKIRVINFQMMFKPNFIWLGIKSMTFCIL